MSVFNEPISPEDLDLARGNLCRKIAVAIAIAMAETNTGPNEIDARLGKPAGHTLRFIGKLLKGRDSTLAPVAEVLCAMGCELKFHLAPKTPKDAEKEDEKEGEKKVGFGK